MRTIAIIPARGGSQRIPGKNIRLFHGKPIIAYSIQAALESGVFDDVYVNTDSDDIGLIAGHYGARCWPRSAGLERDEVSMLDAVADVLDNCLGRPVKQAEWVCCLFATAPMMTAETLQNAEAEFLGRNCDYMVPVGTWLRDPGQFYWGTANAFKRGYPLIGRETTLFQIDPATECDINTEEDWARAEAMYAALHP